MHRRNPPYTGRLYPEVGGRSIATFLAPPPILSKVGFAPKKRKPMPFKQLLIVLSCLAGVIKCLVQQLHNVE